jgi:hypothetical protein
MHETIDRINNFENLKNLIIDVEKYSKNIVCYITYNQYLTHSHQSIQSEILHTCVKLETMHVTIDRKNNFETFIFFSS